MAAEASAPHRFIGSIVVALVFVDDDAGARQRGLGGGDACSSRSANGRVRQGDHAGVVDE